MVIVVDLYNGKYNYNRHYAFGSVDVEKFAEFEKDSCSKRHLDYSKARLSCVSCGIKNDSSCQDSCTCSICTGCYDMLHGHSECISKIDWRTICKDETKALVEGWTNEEIQEKVHARMVHELRAQHHGVVAMLVQLNGKGAELFYRRKSSKHTHTSAACTVRECHAEWFALQRLKKLRERSDKKYVLFVSTVPCIACSRMLLDADPANLQKIIFCDSSYVSNAGVEDLKKMGIEIIHLTHFLKVELRGDPIPPLEVKMISEFRPARE